MSTRATKTVVVIDGNSLMHRAYHAVPPTLTGPDGTPTNAAFGFLAMLIKLIEVSHPDAIVCAFDKGRPAFRTEALEQYKAQRPPMDEDLKVQFPIIEKLLEAMNIPVVSLKGWEGDDILGTISARDELLGYRTLLVTGDKDAYQLASDLTQIVTTKRGITDVAIYGPDEVEERYGVRPDQFIDFLGLKGDKSDNIPGVPGIGDKKAAAMLQEYEHLEGIYEHLDAFRGKQLENLINHREDAFLSRKVATIVRNLEFDLDLENLSFPSFESEKVVEAFQEVRFMAHLSKVLSFVGDNKTELSAPTVSLSWEPLIRGDDAHQALNRAIDKSEPLALAWRENAQASLFDSGLEVAVHLSEGTALFKDEEAQQVLVRLIKEASFSVYDAKSMIGQVFARDTSVPTPLTYKEVLDVNAFDVALAGYILNSTQGEPTLDFLMNQYTASSLPEKEDAEDLLAIEASAVASLVEPLKEELVRHESQAVMAEIDEPLIGVLACMERSGAALDVDRLTELSLVAQGEIDKLKKEVFAEAKEEFNLDSPKQLAHIMFDVLGYKPGKKTQRGYSTDASVLKELAKHHRLPQLVLNYREYAKLKSTYIDALPRMRAGDGRVHTSFNEMVTTTGRLSSSNPNLQNIPVRTETGRHIRECFVPYAENQVFLSADYSQIELRLLAHLSKDEHLIAAFQSDEDFHASTASRVFGVPVEEITPLLRSRAKAINFGIVYGQQAFGLAQSLDIPVNDARMMIERYFEAYPQVRSFLDSLIRAAHEDGYVSTMFGRRRYIPEVKAANANQRAFGERTAMNHPMQGSAADIIKIAMRKAQEALVEQGLKTTLMLQVHDELDFSVPQDELEVVSALVKDCMENVVELSVPLVVDVSAAQNWALAH